MVIYILLTTPGTDAGPFNLYSDTDEYLLPFSLNVSKSTLLEGYVVTVPDGTTVVRIISVGDCTNQIEIVVGTGPSPTTTTTTINPFTWYYGKLNSPGGVVTIPTSTDIDISTGTLVTSIDPSGTIPIPFDSTIDDFIWFAIPLSSGEKYQWYISDINQGDIGGEVSRFGNLFPDPILVNHNDVSMNLYISNYRTNISTLSVT